MFKFVVASLIASTVAFNIGSARINHARTSLHMYDAPGGKLIPY